MYVVTLFLCADLDLIQALTAGMLYSIDSLGPDSCN